MKLRHRKIFKTTSIEDLFEKTISSVQKVEDTYDVELIFLSDLVNVFRPKNPKQLEPVSIRELLDHLEAFPSHKDYLVEIVSKHVSGKTFKNILSEAGIMGDSNFYSEIRKRIIATLIPFQPKKNSLEFTLNQVFYLRTDMFWVKRLSKTELLELYKLLGFVDIYQSNISKSPLNEIFVAIRLLLQRMSGKALESDVIKMVPEYENIESPFEILEKEFRKIEDQIRFTNGACLLDKSLDITHYQNLIEQCKIFVNRAYSNSNTLGISILVNQKLLRIRQQLDCIEEMTTYFKLNKESDKVRKSISLGIKLIEKNCIKNNIKQLVNEGTQIIAYEITQHSARTGEHYITSTGSGYFKMFLSAGLGGVVVGFLCVFKLLLSKLDLSDFGHALVYSLNYAIGFITIYLIGATLATKQPAMTAATVVQAILRGRNETDIYKKYHAFAEFFTRLFRSQFIAFVGNVVFAFPVALALVWLIDYSFGINIAETKAKKLFLDNSPIHTRVIFHSSIAGVFLFLSGIISGAISNSNKHNQLYYRIQEHPTLKRSLGKKKTIAIASWVEKKWAGVASNFWFGVFMGSIGSIGVFIGFDWDIRHITFASGNLALALFGSEFNVTPELLFWAIIGIGVIGFFNFIVSFSLSMFLALRSRNIPFSEAKFLFNVVMLQLKIDPLSFFFPRKITKEKSTPE